MGSNRHRIVCALDTGDLDQALALTRRLAPHVGAFKIGHGLVLPHGLDVIERLREAGAQRVFVDLKFHDIPNSVAIAVREAARRGAWMVTVHLSGGPAMLQAAAFEASQFPIESRPMVVGVSVLTSLSPTDLREELGVQRRLVDHMVHLSEMGVGAGIDGVVCSPNEVSTLRSKLGHAVIVTPGIRPADAGIDDQKRVGTALGAIDDGADYLVIGRALTGDDDTARSLTRLGLLD